MPNKKTLSVGMVAPEFLLPQGGPVWYSTSLPTAGADELAAAADDPDEEEDKELDWAPTRLALKERRALGHVAIYFMRALYCPSGHTYVRRLASQKTKLSGLGATALVIGPGPVAEAASLVERIKSPFPVLADEDGQVVAAYGFRKTLMKTMQQSGVVLVDRSGVVRYVRRVANPMAGIDMDALFLALRNL